ncbi:hypothetical protein ABFS83_08G201500 [Erythranthe nasuta]
MALNFGAASTTLHPRPFLSSKISKQKIAAFNFYYSSSPPCLKAAASLSEGVADDDQESNFSGPSSSARAQLNLLDQLTSGRSSIDGYVSDSSSSGPTIREQLANLVGERDDDFTIPLGKNLKKWTPKFLTVSQKRNIRRQTYLNEVSQRNDSVFFATIGAFVILPPILILGIAIATGYVDVSSLFQ